MRTCLVLALVGCRAPAKPAHEDTVGTTGGTRTDSYGDADTDTDSDADSDSDGDTDADTDPPDTATLGRHVSSQGDFVALSGNSRYACGTHGDGSIDCWWDYGLYLDHEQGPVQSAHVGTGTYSVTYIDEEGRVRLMEEGGTPYIAYDESPVSATAGNCANFNCAVLENGAIDCWTNPGGWSGAPDPWPTDESDFVDVAYLNNIGCALRSDGTVRCWGDDVETVENVPKETFQSIGVGYGLTTGGEVRFWASWMDGWETLDNGPYVRVNAVGSMDAHGGACAIRVDGTADCRARYEYVLPPDATFVEITEPDGPVCGLRPDGFVECFDTTSGTDEQSGTILYPP